MVEPIHIQQVLARIQPTWEEYDPDRLTECETQALNWLVEVGLVQERQNWVFSSPGTPDRVACRFRFTGTIGSEAEATIWAAVSERSRDWPGWVREPQRLDVAPSFWRLTASGESTRADVLADVSTIHWLDLIATREPRAPFRVAVELCEIRRDSGVQLESKDPEWSILVAQKTLRSKLGEITQNTLRSRLIESMKPQAGKIRCQKSSEKAKMIRVAIEDMPESAHNWLRGLR